MAVNTPDFETMPLSTPDVSQQLVAIQGKG
jgi:hypothetical protein